MIPNIELAKPRDFGEVISDTFTFIKQNWKPLLKNYFIFCGFFLLGACLMQSLNAYKMTNVINSEQGIGNLNNPFRIFGLEYVLALVFLFLSYITGTVTTLSYISLYKQNNNEPPTTDEVWGYIKFYYLRVLLAFILTTLLFIAGFVLCILPGFYLYPILSLIFPIMIIENTTFGYAFTRAFELIKENWWATFGTLVVIIIIVYFLALIFALPATIFGVTKLMLHSQKDTHISPITITITTALQQLIQVFTIIPLVAIALCYFNLSETKDGTSLLDRINKFGEGGTQSNLPGEEY